MTAIVPTNAHRHVAALVLTLTVGLLLAACGQPAQPSPAAPAVKQASKPTTLAELAVYEGADRQQILEEGAKKEGTLVWYTSLAGPIVDRMLEAYVKKYPFMKTEVFRGAENELLAKATQEAQANQPSFDVLESQISAVKILLDAKLVTPYYSPSVAKVPDDFKTKASGNTVESATARISYISFGWNTTLIPDSAAPKKMEDLMNPALTGKLSLAGTTTGKRWLASVLHLMGEEKGKQWLTEFGDKQKPSVQQISGKALMDLIAKGEVPASPTIFRDHVDQIQIDSGNKAPVKWAPIDPVVGNTGQGSLAAKAPHPHAALLYLDFLYSDGVKVFNDNGYNTAADKVEFKFWVPEGGRTTTQMEQDIKKWDDLFKVVFRT
jgi:iron(III) transport system substrate-binding protein